MPKAAGAPKALLLLLAPPPVLLVLLLIRLRRDRLRRAYQGLAEQYEGDYFAGDFWECPSISFSHEGVPALVLASNDIVHVDSAVRSGNSAAYYTQLHIAWPDQMRCEIAPRSRFDLPGCFRSTAIRTGSRRFDDRFEVRSEHQEFAKDLLSDEVQNRLMLLRHMRRVPDLYVRFGDGALVIKKRGILRDPQMLERFTKLCLEIYDLTVSHHRFRDKLARVLGILFIEHEIAMDLGDARCPFCGSEFEVEPAVVCDTCHTPHHRDCWEANGCCTIFACGGAAYQPVALGKQ